MSNASLMIVSWLLTVALHGGAWLLLAYAIDRPNRLTRAGREMLWRGALFGGVITATLQLAFASSPFGTWHIASTQSAPVAIATPMNGMAQKAVPISIDAQASRGVSHKSETALALPPSTKISESAGVQNVARSQVATTTSSAYRARPLVLLGVWLLGALFALTRLFVSMQRLRREVAGALPWPETDAELLTFMRRAHACDAHFYTLDALASPLALIGRRIVVPVWAIDSLDWRQLRAMLAHELAHLARRDPQWKIAICLWRAVFWFMPFAGVAQRRLDAIAELACDDWAARATGDAHSVAECLATCAEYQLVLPTPHFAPAMAARRSLLMQRVDALLDGSVPSRNAFGLGGRFLIAALIAICVYALPAIMLIGTTPARADQSTPRSPPTAPIAPAVPTMHSAPTVVPATPATPAATHTHTHTDVSITDMPGWHGTSIEIDDGTQKLSAEVRGKIEFNTDETDVASLDSGGTASFEQTVGGVTRRLELKENSGQLERRYFVDRSEQPYDANARAWFATLVPSLMRESGIGAETRVARLYGVGGADAVLDDIEKIHNNYVRGIYLKLLTARGQLAPAQFDHALHCAGEMDGDYEEAQALKKLFDTQTLDATQQIAFLNQVARIGDDYEKSELLSHAVGKLADNDAARNAWLAATTGISGDYEHARSLNAIVAQGKLSDAQLSGVIDASNTIGGDFEHAEVLKPVAKQTQNVNAIAPAYACSTQKIGGAYEHAQALLALIQRGKLDGAASDAVLDSASKIGASYETSQVLITLAHTMPADNLALVKRYREIASHLSDYERGQAEGALPL